MEGERRVSEVQWFWWSGTSYGYGMVYGLRSAVEEKKGSSLARSGWLVAAAAAAAAGPGLKWLQVWCCSSAQIHMGRANPAERTDREKQCISPAKQPIPAPHPSRYQRMGARNAFSPSRYILTVCFLDVYNCHNTFN